LPADDAPGSAFARYRDVIRKYVPAPYGGRVVVLRPENHPDTRPAMGWTAFVPGAQTVVVAGDHHTVITRHLDATAAQVRSCLQIPTQPSPE
jgi:thioesterase domain-containing protein